MLLRVVLSDTRLIEVGHLKDAFCAPRSQSGVQNILNPIPRHVIEPPAAQILANVDGIRVPPRGKSPGHDGIARSVQRPALALEQEVLEPALLLVGQRQVDQLLGAAGARGRRRRHGLVDEQLEQRAVVLARLRAREEVGLRDRQARQVAEVGALQLRVAAERRPHRVVVRQRQVLRAAGGLLLVTALVVVLMVVGGVVGCVLEQDAEDFFWEGGEERGVRQRLERVLARRLER